MFKRFGTLETEPTTLRADTVPDPDIKCRQCQAAITDPRQRIDMGGSHTHVFTNPQQITFSIACFRLAPGCSYIGSATDEHTWFKGYSWRVALCGRCKTHLGWWFGTSQDSFHGLISEKLTTGGD